MPDDPIAPDFTETRNRAKFHLEEAARVLTAKYPLWAGNKPTPIQRGVMRRAARYTNKAIKQLDLPAANDTPTDTGR
ncbi:hypothetical protein [Glycomyces buryatensis]|uniref:Uncharacterized protein n=1 Tax=Glycomyces buryatensis TaxID=2570927 RepID=A0A4S8Q8G6_9ACTN|nr:hypothetical protein [Glycomyces buryatensis]THV40568.1 hypothetical protein FAB82_14980 [Glycomyces buryatensis]